MKRTACFFLSCCLALISCTEKKSGEPRMIRIDPPRDTANRKPEASINQYAPVDVSPMDMSYYPVEYPKLRMAKADIEPPKARVIYSRPHLQGRHLFHDILQYGEPWRLGANEATELDLYEDVSIMDKKIKAGRYILYCIPGQLEWTIILNSRIDSWGLDPDPALDVARFIVPVKKTNNSLEFFTMVFEQPKTGKPELVMAWDNIEARLPFSF